MMDLVPASSFFALPPSEPRDLPGEIPASSRAAGSFIARQPIAKRIPASRKTD